MARCPFAIWIPHHSSAGRYTGGPYKIVLHTTEGSTASGAIGVLGSRHVESHFVVDEHNVFQLLDTGEAARSLRNAAGGVETNRDGAIQIEMVGFAGKLKNRAMLANTRRLCEWLEREHGVPRAWPNGYCRPAVNGEDPGHHNRDPYTWDNQGGYYGHEHVPENTHWDPALTEAETEFLMNRSEEEPLHA